MNRLARVYWPCYLAWQIFLARVVTIDFFDAAATLLNARTLSGAPLDYTSYRPPMVSALHAPLIALLSAARASPSTLFWAPHVFQALLSMACLACVYAYLRRFLPDSWAQAGTILFSLDRLTVHYFFAAMTDIPCALFLLGAYLWGSGRTRRSAALGCLSLAACLLCRWNMLIVPAALLALAPALSQERRGRAVWIATGSLALFLAGNILAYHRALGLGPADASRFLARTMWSQFRENSAREPASGYFASLLAGSGVGLCALSVLGAARAAAEGPGELSLHAGFFAYFFLVMTFVVGHKESRYLYPALPSFYLLAVRGLKLLHESAGRSGRRWAPALLLAAVAAGATARGLREWRRFADPVYRSRTVTALADVVEQSRGPSGKIYWFGFAHSIVPKDPVFVAGDAFYYLYHVPSPDLLEYLTGRRVLPLPSSGDLQPGDVIVRAPGRLFRLDRPITAAEDRLSVWRAADHRRLERLAVFD